MDYICMKKYEGNCHVVMRRIIKMHLDALMCFQSLIFMETHLMQQTMAAASTARPIIQVPRPILPR